MEDLLHDRTEASTDLYLPPKRIKQNKSYSKQGYKVNQNTDVHYMNELKERKRTV